MKLINLLLALLLICTISNAQEIISRKKARAGEQPPKFILVKLSSETNRVSALKQAGATRRLAMVREDAAKIRQATVTDFRDNFTFCPVYFFIDTNLDAITARHLDGFIMDANGKPVHDINASDSFNIVTYNILDKTKDKYANPHGKASDYHGNYAINTGLLVFNSQYIPYGDPYPYFVGRAERLTGTARKAAVRYRYVSKHFDMEYDPRAGRLSSRFSEYFSRWQRKHRP